MARILAPFQGAVAIISVYQGLRSFHSLNPWLFSFHAFRREHKPADSRSYVWAIVTSKEGTSPRRLLTTVHVAVPGYAGLADGPRSSRKSQACARLHSRFTVR